MAEFQGVLVTKKGLALLAKAQTGAILRFTKVKVGDGEPSQESLEAMEDLINPKLTLDISRVQSDSEGVVAIKARITNEGLTEGFFVKEIGVYAMEPDLNQEILYAVSTSKNPDYIPAFSSKTVVNNEFGINLVVGNNAKVEVNINPLGTVSQKEFDDHLKQTDDKAHPEALRTLNPSLVPTNDPAKLSEILNWFAHQFQAITGNENWWEKPVTSLMQEYRDKIKIMLILETEGRGPSTAGSFLDTLDGVSNRCTLLDESADLTQAVAAGTTTLPIDMRKGTFLPNTQLVIADDLNQEEVFVTAVNNQSIEVTALGNDYKKGARISRSNAVLDLENHAIRIGEWGTFTIEAGEAI